MRIIGYIDHPDLKITVFRMDNRWSVKLENEGYEQTFKLGDAEPLNNFEAIKAWLDQVFLQEAEGRMQEMHQSRLSAQMRVFPQLSVDEFEEII